MKAKRILLIIGMGAIFVLTSCIRQATEEPSPFGPASSYLTFTFEARPNVLYATSERATSEIRATVKRGGSPVKDATVYFSILYGPGFFSDYSTRIAVLTNEVGVASITYYSPTKYEIGYDQDVCLRAQLETSTPEYMHKELFIHILVAD
ncbi:MAG: hypothetical protein WCC06_13505 [Candidatus Aminicenantales bacterium]